MSAVVLALAAAFLWGVSDFLAGVASRARSASGVLVVSQAIGFAIVALALVVSSPAAPGGRLLLYAALSGLSVAVALGSLYKGMQIGSISMVAPISATAVVVPVAFSLVRGDSATSLEVAGFVLAFAGVVLAAFERGERYSIGFATGSALALLAAAGGGLNNVFIDLASTGGVLWTLAVQRSTVAICAYASVRVRRTGLSLTRAELPLLLGIGALDVVGTGSFALATTRGVLSVVAVAAALYPVVTVLSARVFLGERVSRVRAVGAFAAIAGVAMLASTQT